MPVRRNTISLDEGIYKLAKAQADKMHMNFSEYIAHLVRKEFELYTVSLEATAKLDNPNKLL